MSDIREKFARQKAANAEKQKRFREKQKAQGKKMVRGYLNKEGLACYQDLQEITGWTDNDILSNALRITYAAYKKGQIRILNHYLEENKR